MTGAQSLRLRRQIVASWHCIRIAAARFFPPEYLAILDAEESPSEEETDWGGE